MDSGYVPLMYVCISVMYYLPLFLLVSCLSKDCIIRHRISVPSYSLCETESLKLQSGCLPLIGCFAYLAMAFLAI